MNGGSPDHVTLSEMLDALEKCVDVLLLTNQRLAERLQESEDLDAIETEEMKRKKSSEGSPFGLLFPELEADRTPQDSLFTAPQEENQEVAADVKRKRAPKPKKAAEEAVACTPEPAPAAEVVAGTESEELVAGEPDAPNAAEAAAEPESVELVAEEHEPVLTADAVAEAEPESAMPDWVTAEDDLELEPVLEAGAEAEPEPPPPEMPKPTLRPVLVQPPVSNGTRPRHPFAELGNVPVRPSNVASASPRPASDVHWSFPVEEESNRRPETLRRHMEKAGLAGDELAGALGVPVAALNGWLSGNVPVPAWVLPSVRVLELVTPSARLEARGTLSTNAVQEAVPARKTVSSQPGYRHPFSRIEEL